MRKNNKSKNKNLKNISQSKSHRKILEGEVVSNKMEKTVVVKVEARKTHPLYKKIITTSKRYKAHTEENLKIGDIVQIEQCKPISKEKKWKVKKVINK